MILSLSELKEKKKGLKLSINLYYESYLHENYFIFMVRHLQDYEIFDKKNKNLITLLFNSQLRK